MQQILTKSAVQITARASRWYAHLVFLSLLMALVLVPCRMQAQIAGSASIQGTVMDSTGAVVANAAVSLTDEATHVKRTTKSDGSGLYGFPGVPIGTYDLTVAAAGFKTYIQKGIVLEVGSSIAVNAGLSVGAADVQVEVSAEGLALQTEDATFKQTIDHTAVTEMPLNGRQMTALITALRRLKPGPRWGLYRKQILLPDHLCLYCRRRR